MQTLENLYLEPFLHVGVIVSWFGYLLLLRTVAPHVVAREWGIRANGGFNCEVLLISEEYSITINRPLTVTIPTLLL